MEEVYLSAEELVRYSRHIAIPEFTIENQKKLKSAKVLVVGAGGLGSPVLLYLAAAGVGTIGIVDFDVVDVSNLQRQILFGIKDLGKSKAIVAKEKLLDLNPHVNFIIHEERLSSLNALEIFQQYEVVVDGSDNFVTRYLVNDASVFANIPNVYASVLRFEGQVSVFNYKQGPNYRDLYPTPPAPATVLNCAEGGVLGVLPGIIGSMQANEVIKIITDIGEPLSGRLFRFDALNASAQTFQITKDPFNPLTGEHPEINSLIDYEQFCDMVEKKEVDIVRAITVQQLRDKITNKEDFQLIDVREKWEYDLVRIGGMHLPLDILNDCLDQIARDKIVIVHCKMGGRSARAIQQLQLKGFDNLYNLEGGIIAYVQEVDPTLPLY